MRTTPCKRPNPSKEKLEKSEVQKVLDEATNNDNWNISNTKLQVLADHSYDWYVESNNRNEYNIIMKHLWSKIELQPKEWRKIFKVRNLTLGFECFRILGQEWSSTNCARLER